MRPTLKDLYVPAGVEGGVALGEARPASRLDLLHAAGLLAVCEDCGGTGWMPDEPDGRDVPDMSFSGCPTCHVSGETGGRGLVVALEAVERAAVAIAGDRAEEVSEEHFADAAAGLRAVLFGGGE